MTAFTTQSRKRKGLALYGLFLLLTALLLGLFLLRAHQNAAQMAENRLSFTTALISEWIQSAFVASDYLLRDMAAEVQIDDLRYPHPDPAAQAELNARLESRRKTLPFAFLHGAFDQNCIVTHGNAVLGFDASQREYCQRLRDEPGLDRVVTHGYQSNVGPVNVTHARALRSPQGEFQGMVAIALDTDFFTQWLTRMGDGQVETLAIIDHRQMMLARFPPMPSAIGVQIDSPEVIEFLASGKAFQVVSTTSPLDGKVRDYGGRVVDGLPFAIIVGMERGSWMAEWNRLAVLGLLGFLVIAALGAFALRTDLQLIDGRVELQQQAQTDALTGLANRFYFTEMAHRELARARRTGSWVSVLLIDVDRFKKINDTHGHQVGDRALQAFAACCRQQVRAEDALGRWGGDEFVVLLAQNQEVATQLAERLMASLRAYPIVNDQGTPFQLDASIGLTSAKADAALDLDELIRQADVAMLQAKQQGRGRIGHYDPSSDAPATQPHV